MDKIAYCQIKSSFPKTLCNPISQRGLDDFTKTASRLLDANMQEN
jgi:hypothetical protein